jgi:predicted DNA-binding protein YlxM (UPF0122 family)
MENHNEYDIEKLRYYYFEKKLPIAEIAKIHSTTPIKMFRILKKSFPNIEYRKVKNRMLRQNLTKEELIELHYNKRMPLSTIAKMYGVPYSTVHDYMKLLNLPTNKNIKTKEKPIGYKIEKINLPKEKLYELYYEQKLSLQKIGKLYGKPSEYIHRRMNIYGFKSRTKSEAWEQRGKYEINEKFFDNWSDRMAYVLGLILTDGSIGNDDNRISITMKEGHHLEKIKKMLHSQHPVRYNKLADTHEYVFVRKIMAARLFKLGITRNKSLKVKFPDVPDKYLSHFIRGVFDGDGSVFFEPSRKIPLRVSSTNGSVSFMPRSNKSPLRVSFTSGSKAFITTLESNLHLHAGLPKRTIYERLQKRMSYYIRYCHTDSIKFFDYIYEGADESMRLERKYQKFLESIRKSQEEKKL